MDISREEFVSYVDIIRADIKGVQDRLDDINGRTRITEQNIAVLQDRSNRFQGETKRITSRWGAGAVIIAAMAEFLHQWFGK